MPKPRTKRTAIVPRVLFTTAVAASAVATVPSIAVGCGSDDSSSSSGDTGNMPDFRVSIDTFFPDFRVSVDTFTPDTTPPDTLSPDAADGDGAEGGESGDVTADG